MHFIHRLFVYIEISSAVVKILTFVSCLIFLYTGLFQNWKNLKNIFHPCLEKDSCYRQRINTGIAER